MINSCEISLFGSINADIFFYLAAGLSQLTTTNTSSSGTSSNVSGNSRFSAASGSEEAYPNGQILPHPNLRIFSFSELKAATRNFRGDTVLGEGGFGKVYKGWLDEKSTSKNSSSTVIAVKKLNSGSMQGFEEWQVNSKKIPTLLSGTVFSKTVC